MDGRGASASGASSGSSAAGVAGAPERVTPGLVARAGLGGSLMGLANLVPGISGGTMLLAAGVYPRFIGAISDATRLRFSAAGLAVLLTVGAAAGLAIVLLAGPVKDVVVHHRWAAYSAFIGLTLGGVPLVWRLARPATPGVWAGALAGFVGMALLAIVQAQGLGTVSSGGRDGLLFMFAAGVAGASAMILPGVSGGYLLLVLGVYVPILASIERLKDAAGAADLGAAIGEWRVIIPVGLGVVVGIAGVSNGLKVLLDRFPKPTLGVLLGLLVGAVAGLWPFQRGVAPAAGDMIKGQVLTAETAALVPAEDWPVRYFTPEAWQIGASAGLIAAGFALTMLVARIGRDKPSKRSASA